MGGAQVKREEIETAVKRLNRITGNEYIIDYYPTSGGYRITTKGGGTPYGNKRRVAKQMLDVVEFAIDVLTHKNGESV